MTVSGSLSTIPVALVGLGRIASLLEDDPLREKPCTHAGSIVATGRCRIVGGADSNAERRSQFTARWDVPTYEDARTMIGDVRPAVLVVATHPDSHEQYVRLATREEVPIVVCEKPLAHNLRSARRIVRLERAGVCRIVVNHERRFSRDYQLVREAIASQKFGLLLRVSGTLFFGRTRRQDRVLLHDGTHLLDAIHFLTDDSVRFYRRVGSIRRTRSSTFIHGVLQRRRLPVVIEVGAERDYLHLEIELSFTAGRIRVGNGIYSWERSRTSPHYSGYRSLIPVSRNVPEPTGYFRSMMEEAVRLFEEPTALSRSSAHDAYTSLRVIAQARRAFRFLP